MGESLKDFFVGLGLDVDEKAWNKADKLVDRLSGSLKKGLKVAAGVAAGALALAGGVLAKWSSDVLSATDETAKLAAQVGLTTEQVQELEFALTLSGGSLEDVRTSFRRLADGADDAVNKGTGPAKEAFDALNVSVTDANGEMLGQMELFENITEQLSKVDNKTRQVALANDIFGRSGAKLLPLINQGAEGLAELRQEARDLGFVVDGETAAAMEALNDDIERGRRIMDGWKNQLVISLLPTLQNVVNGLLGWMKTNREVIRQRLDRAMEKLAGVLEKLEKAWKRLNKFVEEKIGGWPKLFQGIAAALGAAGVLKALFSLKSALVLLIPALKGILAVGAVFLIKVIAIAAAVALLFFAIEDLITGLRGGESYTKDFLDAWEGTDSIFGSIIELFQKLWGLAQTVGEFLGVALPLAFELWWAIAGPILGLVWDGIKAVADLLLGSWKDSLDDSTSDIETLAGWFELATEKLRAWSSTIKDFANVLRTNMQRGVDVVRTLIKWIGKLPLDKIAKAGKFLGGAALNPASAVAEVGGRALSKASSFVFGDTNVETRVQNSGASAEQIASASAKAVDDTQRKRLQTAYARLEGGER